MSSFDEEESMPANWDTFAADNAEEAPSHSLKPMAVASTGDYRQGQQRTIEGARWKATLASVLSIIFLMIGYTIMHQHIPIRGAVPAKNATSGNAEIDRSTLPPSVCHDLDQQRDSYLPQFQAKAQQQQQQSTTTENASPDPDFCRDDARCRCHNPLVPQGKVDVQAWQDTARMNLDLLQNYTSTSLDVVMYGDSITERLLGRHTGHFRGPLAKNAEITQQLFSKENGGRINGLPLGVSGDEVSDLLYRLRHGEMPEWLHPKVWWILIGTNDATMGCTADVIVAGNIAMVEEIRRRQHTQDPTTATTQPIVINSLLPRGSKELLTNNRIWSTLSEANHQLACYAARTPGVVFVNMTDLFTETRLPSVANNDHGGVFVHEDLFAFDYVHLSAEGSRVWEEAISNKVVELINQ